MAARAWWVPLLLHLAHSLPAAVAPVLVGAAFAYHNHVFSLLPVILGLIASWCIHVGGLYLENYWLLTAYAPLREHPDLADAVDDGTLSLRTLRRLTVAWFVFGALFGASLIRYAGVMAPVLGLIGMIGSATYCAGRYSQTRLGIADPVFFVLFGIVAVAGTYYVQAAQFFVQPVGWHVVAEALPWQVCAIGLPLGAIITNVMVVDDLSDIAIDKAKNWRTRPVVWGAAGGRAEYVILTVFAYALPFWFWRGLGLGPGMLLPLLSLPLAIWTTRLVFVTRLEDVEPVSAKTAGVGLCYAALLSAGLIIGS
jgi:1,4-dihydroxy-2-naphthoate octaprenyltransferase